MDYSESLQQFYSGFADKYDLYMAWENRIRRERRFFKYVLDSNRVNSVLDCFCGTGFHVSMLSDMGYDVEGIDISPAMVAMAKENLKAKGFDGCVRLGDAKALNNEKVYDCVLSMGNSLPHEFGDENVLKTLQSMHDALRPGGICVIQMENYERLYEDRQRFIPSVYRRSESGTETFIFAIEYGEDKVVFNILSVIERAGLPKFAVDTVEYNPIMPLQLESFMKEAGFGDLTYYEDFRMSPLKSNGTYDLIVIAHR